MSRALPVFALTVLSLSFFATGSPAQSKRVFDRPTRGSARPPLWHNSRPGSIYYTPAQIRHAYGVDQLNTVSAVSSSGLNGSGQTIAIVDAYGSPSIQKDLNTFCSSYGLPPTAVQISYPQGPVGKNTGWAQETSLDVEWAHAIAPGAKILLVAAKSSSYTDLLGAVDNAVALGASVVSMSWGGGETSSETSYDSHFNVPGVTFVASSGDAGESSGVEYPACSPYVAGVGGTTLSPNGLGGYVETAWSGSGGGISVYENSLSFQSSSSTLALNGRRGVPDVSFVADPKTGVVVVYNAGFYVFGGTSVGAPQWAALVALSNSSGHTSGALPSLYTLSGISPTSATISAVYFLDITSGNNGSTADADDFAFTGYDLVTGLGSPKAAALVPALIGR